MVNENVQENVRNVLVTGNRVGCSYKEFLAYNAKEYDGNGGDVVLTRWIEKMKSVQDMSGCSIDQKVKYIAGLFMGKNHTMVGAGHAAYTDRFRELARLVPHLLTLESRKIDRYMYGLTSQICEMVAATEPKTMQKAVQIFDALTDEDKNGMADNKRTGTGNAFATTANPVGRENMGAWPKCTTHNSYHAPGGPCRTCFNCNCPGHLARDDKVMPRNVNSSVGESPEYKARLLMSAKANGKKQEEIVVVRDFSEVFPDDLSGLPPLREIKFRIELIRGAVPIANSSYRLAP
nr:hypothetical protein [Tanacetum cinerariifolium]